MDPISIATVSVHLIGACGRLSGYLYTFIKKTQTVHTAIRRLGKEQSRAELEVNSVRPS